MPDRLDASSFSTRAIEQSDTGRETDPKAHMLQSPTISGPALETGRRMSIGFLNWAHALDHYVMLIFPTVVISLALVEGRSYAELIALGTGSFVAFGVFSLPAGWLADRWSRRNMMVLFHAGCGLSLAAAGLAPNLTVLAVALTSLGVFAAIYHPVGMPMLVAAATSRGRTLAFNGVCGNLGAALAAGITAALIEVVGWRGAFLVPSALLLATGVIYPWLVPDDRSRAAGRSAAPDVLLTATRAAVLFGLFVIVALTAGLVLQTISVALPKIVDERLEVEVPLFAVGGLATAVFMCGALAQLAVGRLAERLPMHLLFALVALLQLGGVAWAASARGATLLAALALTMAASYAQVTVNDLVIARYTADAWRGRVYAVRYFLTFAVSGVAVWSIGFLYGRGGFDLVLWSTVVVALGLAGACLVIAFLVNDVERARTAVPAE
jgi:MFS family permease